MGDYLYPAVGLRTPRESVVVNFLGPFKYDIDKHVREVRDQVWQNALRPNQSRSFVIPNLPDEFSDDEFTEENQQTDKRKEAFSSRLDHEEKCHAALILDHLANEGCPKAYTALAREMRARQWIGGKSEASTQPMVEEASTQTMAGDREVQEPQGSQGAVQTALFRSPGLQMAEDAAEMKWFRWLIRSSDTVGFNPESIAPYLDSYLSSPMAGLYTLHFLYLLRRDLQSELDAQPGSEDDKDDNGGEQPDEAKVTQGGVTAAAEDGLAATPVSQAPLAVAEPSPSSPGAHAAPGETDEMDAISFARRITPLTHRWLPQQKKEWTEAISMLGVPLSNWNEHPITREEYRNRIADDSTTYLRRESISLS